MKYISTLLLILIMSACQFNQSQAHHTQANHTQAHHTQAQQDIQTQTNSSMSPVFELITLGDTGGIEDGNLSSFLLRSVNDENFIGLDAGH